MRASASGMILFDKPEGWTSHDAVAAFRRMLPKGAKVGHCGTLDPLATGLLILLVGPCTRLQARMQGLDKVYAGRIRLGVRTDTGDVTGTVLETKTVPSLDLARVQACLDSMVGALEMPAPAYSAVKHKGKALYRYARAGLEVPVKPRSCTVFSWKALGLQSPDFEHRLTCSSGTYVRSLAELAGSKLGCGATVLTLRRERIAGFRIEDAITLEAARKLDSGSLQRLMTASLMRLGETLAQANRPMAPDSLPL
ncbi:MAG TPA: tRNA pseudouridine(55) synthase TruB [Elusimicrobia bacterium]|nr:tRNA pseudouridine(55) synthase TruB [Elusimicrobiota bacterium]HBT61702.1 tRNA pseudouridine(55) synthase TruB [Elusimicrobiota bacterium]